MPTVTCHAWDDRPPGTDAAWAGLLATDPIYASPCYRPELYDELHRVTGTVELAVVRDGAGTIAGVLPFQRRARRAGIPAGYPLTDYQGMIGSSLGVAAGDVLAACGLSSLSFDHVPAGQPLFQSGVRVTGLSKVIDLSGGYAAWVEDRKAAGSSIVAQTDRKLRKFAKSLGEPAFEFASSDRAALHQILAWKREQYAKTHVPDHLRPAWTVAWLERLFDRTGDTLRLELATLKVDGRLVAGNLSLVSGPVVHWWFPAYDPALSDHSPGVILMLEHVRQAARDGRQMIDLGKGDEGFKDRFANRTVPLIEGGLERGTYSRLARTAWYSVRSAVRGSSWGRAPLAAFRRLRAAMT